MFATIMFTTTRFSTMTQQQLDKRVKDLQFWAKVKTNAVKADKVADTCIGNTAYVVGAAAAISCNMADKATKGKATKMASPMLNWVKFKVQVATSKSNEGWTKNRK